MAEMDARLMSLVGANHPLIQRVLDQIPLITDEEVQELGVAWSATRDAAFGAAWDAAQGAAHEAAWDAAWYAARYTTRSAAWPAARDAVIALVVHDLVGQHGLEQHHIDTLLAPWISVMGDPRDG